MTVYSVGGGGMVVDIETAETLARTDPIALAVRKAMESTTPELQAEIDSYFNEEDFGPIVVNELTKRKYDPELHDWLRNEAETEYGYDEAIVPGINEQLHWAAVRSLAIYEEDFADEIMRRNESDRERFERS